MGEDEIQEAPNEWEDGDFAEAVDTAVDEPSPEVRLAELQAQLEQERQARAQFEETANKRLSDKDRQITKTLEAVRKRGLDVTEGGDLATTDVTKLAALLGQQQQSPKPSPLDQEINPFADDFSAQLAAREAAIREQTKNDLLKELMPAIQQMTGLSLQTQQPQVESAIAQQFERLGLPGLQDTPEFIAYREQESRNITDPVSLASPQWMAQMAMTFLPRASDTLIQSVREKAAQKASQEKAQRERQEQSMMRQQMGGSGDARHIESGGRNLAPGDYDEAYWLIRNAMGGDPRYDEQLNRAEAHGKTNDLLEKRRAKAKAR